MMFSVYKTKKVGLLLGMLDIIFKRRSIRAFLDQPVEKEKIITCLQAAMAAPTAANSQPWEFVVVDDCDIMSQFRKSFVFANYNAPCAIVVCSNEKLAFKGPGHEMWVQDCSAATQNILLAATSLGLGSLWIGIYPLEHNIKRLKRIISLPEEVTPLNIIYLGYPNEVKPPRTRYNEKRVYWNHYDQSRKHRLKDKPKTGHY
jgi:nitroreductase